MVVAGFGAKLKELVCFERVDEKKPPVVGVRVVDV